MSTPRIDPNVPPLPVQGPKPSQPAPSTPFSQILGNTSSVLINGAQSQAGVMGGPVLAAAIREAGGQALGASVAGGSGGGGLSGSAAAAAAGGPPGSEISQMHAMQRESQAFNLQLLNLQNEVQDENRRFTTVSNCLKAAHDTAKAATNNMHA